MIASQLHLAKEQRECNFVTSYAEWLQAYSENTTRIEEHKCEIYRYKCDYLCNSAR